MLTSYLAGTLTADGLRIQDVDVTTEGANPHLLAYQQQTRLGRGGEGRGGEGRGGEGGGESHLMSKLQSVNRPTEMLNTKTTEPMLLLH